MHLPHMARDQNAKVVGNLVIEFRPSEIRPSKPNPCTVQRIDILPFVKYCNTTPTLAVQCRMYGCDCKVCEKARLRQQETFRIVCDVARRPRLHAWLLEAVSGVYIDYMAGLNFVVHAEHAPDWMRAQWDHEDVDWYDPGLLSWIANTGLPAHTRFTCSKANEE